MRVGKRSNPRAGGTTFGSGGEWLIAGTLAAWLGADNMGRGVRGSLGGERLA